MAVNQPFSTLLNELLTPMELTWRTIDGNTIEITTPQALAAGMDVEFYSVRNLAGDAAAGKALRTKLPRKSNRKLGEMIPRKRRFISTPPDKRSSSARRNNCKAKSKHFSRRSRRQISRNRTCVDSDLVPQ